MTPPPTRHPAVETYLAELSRLLQGADPAEAAETLAGVREHIDASLAGTDADDAAVQRVLAELGPPQTVAAAAYDVPTGGVPTAPARALNRRWVPVVVAIAQILGLLIILL